MDDDYDLQVLLKLRAEQRDKAEARYADALAAYQQQGQAVQALELEYRRRVSQREAGCREFDKRLASEPCAIGRVHEFDRYVAGLRDGEQAVLQQVEEAARQRRRLRREMARAQQQMVRALKQLKAVQEHYEKWQRRQQGAAKRRREVEMDDVAARIWRQNQPSNRG